MNDKNQAINSEAPIQIYNPEIKGHYFPLGSLVEVKNTGIRMYVVEHRRSLRGEKIYNLYHSRSVLHSLMMLAGSFTDDITDDSEKSTEIWRVLERIREGFLKAIPEEDLYALVDINGELVKHVPIIENSCDKVDNEG